MMLKVIRWRRLLHLKDSFWSPGNHCTPAGLFQQPGKLSGCLSKSTNAAENEKFQNSSNFPGPTSTVKVLYDGECNLCVHEISLLKRIARQRPVDFVDITTPEFTDDKYGGVSYEMAMKEMHVIGADGKVHVQFDAVRELYKACGMGWMVTITQLPVLSSAFNAAYMQFAVYRLKAALDRCDSGISCSIKLKHLRDKLRAPQN